MIRLAFCEPVTATTMSHEHIRAVDGPLRTGGGIEGAALCGYDVSHGWDNLTEVTPDSIRRGAGSDVNPTCVRCGQIALAVLSC